MANKSNTVTISLEEYRELLLKDKPSHGNDGEMLERIFGIIEPNLEYVERNYSYSNDVMRNVKVKDSDKVLVEIFQMIKYLDFDRYMKMWNMVMTNERKRKEQEMKIEQMNQAKELRKANE